MGAIQEDAPKGSAPITGKAGRKKAQQIREEKEMDMGEGGTGRTTPHYPAEHPQDRPLYTPPPPKKQEPVRRASVETGAGMILGSALVLIMKHVFKTDLSIEDALMVVSAVGLVANYLSGEVARLKVYAPEK